MIKSITIRDVASYDHTGVTFSDLKKVNFIYGGNGTGKTTLGRVLNTYDANRDFQGLCTTEWEGEPVEVLAYNRDFKERNLQESIPGVFTIGEDQQQINRDLDHWRQKRQECSDREMWAYRALGEVNKLIEAEKARLQEELWQKLYQPYSPMKGCLEGYDTKVAFAEKILFQSQFPLMPFLHLETLDNYLSLYRELFIDESDSPSNPNASTLRWERENLANDLWMHLAQLGQKEVKAHQKAMRKLNKKLNACQEAHEAAMLSLSQVDQSIKSTESVISSLQPSIDRINNALQQYGFTGFRIQPAPGAVRHYQIQRSNGRYVKASLSEGEQTFITFLYYMQLVEGMTTDHNFGMRRVLVIDDPICSLDGEVLYVVHTMLRRLIAQVLEGTGNVQQLIILTHNTEFHRLLSQRKRNPEVHYYKLVKREGATRLLAFGEENPVKSDYEMQWQELRALRAGHSVPNAPNAMRKILETYFVRLGGYDKDDLFENLFVDDPALLTIANSLRKWLDEGSHGTTDGLYLGDTDTLNERYLEVFREIFARMGHEAHYQMMMKQ